MKIADCETFVVDNPPPHFGGRYFLFVKLTTDDGIDGIGEAYVATFSPNVVADMISDAADRHLMGNSPFSIETMWHRMFGTGYASRPDITLAGVMSALEMACWDIVGKAVGKPVYELLGGQVHEALRSYTYLYPDPDDKADVYADPEIAARRAAEEVARGFTAVKFDPAGPYTVFDPHQPSVADLERSESMVKAVREAVGTQADILFGTHGQFSASGATRLARRLEPYDPLWFEEPTPATNHREMAKVASQTSIPIATGERLTTKHEFAEVLMLQAASILQPNLGRAGGILEGKKIAALAEAHHAHIAPHLYCGPVVGAANIQLATCSPNFLILEGIRDWSGFHAEILENPIRWENGYVVPSTEPGLGVVLNEEVALAHPYAGDDPHLKPGQDPYPWN